MTLGQYIYQFASLAIQHGGWMAMDRLYIQNRILSLIGAKTVTDLKASTENPSLQEMLSYFIEEARKNAVIHHEEQEAELRGQLYDLLTPPPAVLNACFSQLYNEDPERALHYFHQLSLLNKSIQEEAQLSWIETQKGSLVCSKTAGRYQDNLPRQTKVYPRCSLCFENEGYDGTGQDDVRAPFRYIRMNLQGESFGFRYAPYPLWKEHALFVAEEHGQQMHSRKTVDQLLQLADLFPQHFVACPSDLLDESYKPQHLVYQGGKGDLPLLTRAAKAEFHFTAFPEVQVEVLDYPLTVCRLQSNDRLALLNLATAMMQQWRVYGSEGSPAFLEEGQLNHSVSFVMRKEKEDFVVYLCFQAKDTPYDLQLAQVLGVAAVYQSEAQTEVQTLAKALATSDPFHQNASKIDAWMQKVNEVLGE